jgi:hypothetical protein
MIGESTLHEGLVRTGEANRNEGSWTGARDDPQRTQSAPFSTEGQRLYVVPESLGEYPSGDLGWIADSNPCSPDR